MSFIDSHAPATDGAQGDLDLGPLAWVLDELRKSLHSAVHAVRRFVRTAEIAQESDLEALDVGPLRTARQQLHQGFGVLEMVGMAAPALLLQAMESAVQKFVRRPETCRDDAAATVERASFALVEYLETVLAGKEASPVALFPQYREVQALAEVEHVHPADLWPVERRFREPEGALPLPPLVYGPQARAQLDSMVLRTVKSGIRRRRWACAISAWALLRRRRIARCALFGESARASSMPLAPDCWRRTSTSSASPRAC